MVFSTTPAVAHHVSFERFVARKLYDERSMKTRKPLRTYGKRYKNYEVLTNLFNILLCLLCQPLDQFLVFSISVHTLLECFRCFGSKKHIRKI